MLDYGNMSDLIKRAYKIATDAHKGQVDKAGKDYILHPMTVASNVGDDEYAIVVGLLHDVVEDTEVTFDDLSKEFPKDVIDALRYVTHRIDESYMDYVRRIKESNNPIALKVKLADLKHNMDLSRFDIVSEKEINRLNNKYIPALEYLVS